MSLLLAFCLSSALAEDVAAVLAVDGSVQIERAAGTVDAAPRLSIDRADRVHTGEDGAVILLLSNNRLVRVDEDLDLAVKDIVLLNAPKTTVPVKDQLADLLYPGERETMRGVEDAERIAGWQARLSAATAVPAQAVAAKVPDQAKELVAAPGGELVGNGYQGEGEDAGYQKIADSESTAVAPADDEVAELPTYDAAGVEKLLRGDLAACMKDWRKADGFKKGTQVTLHFKVEGGRIVRITGDNGVTPACCLRDEILGAGAAGSFDVTVTLP